MGRPMSSAATMGLHPLPERGWRAGLSPLMRAEFGAWWRTREWWTQALLWTVVINGSVAVAVWGDAPEGLGVFGLYGVMTMFAAIAVAILMQETIVGEKRSGTAAWFWWLPPRIEPRISTNTPANSRYFGSWVTRNRSIAPMMFEGLNPKWARSLGRGENRSCR